MLVFSEKIRAFNLGVVSPFYREFTEVCMVSPEINSSRGLNLLAMR